MHFAWISKAGPARLVSWLLSKPRASAALQKTGNEIENSESGGNCSDRRGCNGDGLAVAAAGNVEKRPVEVEVSKPCWFDAATELEDREAHEHDYEEVLHCLRNRSDFVRYDAVRYFRTRITRGWSSGSPIICKLNCCFVGEEISKDPDEEDPDDSCDEKTLLSHQWRLPLPDSVPADVVDATSQDWPHGMKTGSIKNMWWQKMHHRRLRQKITEPKIDLFSIFCDDWKNVSHAFAKMEAKKAEGEDMSFKQNPRSTKRH